jgi:serine/threonine-protein kinase
MAEVHAGHDTRLGRAVAIKLLRSDLARDPSFLSRFRREAQSTAGLNHPSIVAVYDSGEDEHTDTGGATVVLPYIVMEYIEGHTLREVLTENKVLSPTEAARVTEGILNALAYSHRMGIVHRDIKPANVILTPAGEVKVMDFGIARAIADSAATMTQTSSVIGTAQYLSPEQAQGNPVDARSDLYSTGCLLYELLTGRTPFVGDSPVSIAYQHVGEAPQPPSTHQTDISADLDAVVLHSLAKDREARYQDAAQFRSDLAAARSGQPISAAARGAAAGAALGAGAMTTVFPVGGDPTIAMSSANPTEVVAAQGERQHNTATLPAIGRDPSEMPGKRHGATYALLSLAVVAALVLVGIAAKSLFTGDAAPHKVAVPSVLSLTQAEAVARLRAAGFQATISPVANQAEKGRIVDQNPQPGVEQAANTAVNISVSTGPDKVDVPDVHGYTEASASEALKGSELTVGKVQKVNDPSQDEGKVIETDPPAGANVPKGSAVILKVASGMVRVPNVVGKDRGEAQQILTDKRLKYRTTFEDSNEDEGTVLSQTKAGRNVDIGTEIVLVVAQAAQPTATPTAPTTPPTTAPTTGAPTTAP